MIVYQSGAILGFFVFEAFAAYLGFSILGTEFIAKRVSRFLKNNSKCCWCEMLPLC